MSVWPGNTGLQCQIHQRQRQGDLQFKAALDNLERPCLKIKGFSFLSLLYAGDTVECLTTRLAGVSSSVFVTKNKQVNK